MPPSSPGPTPPTEDPGEVLRAWADALAAAGRHAEAYALAREALAGEQPGADQLPQRSSVPTA